MKPFIITTLYVFLQIISLAKEQAKIRVHIIGHVSKPGSYQINRTISPREIKQICGGWNLPWAAINRAIIMRFAGTQDRPLDNPSEKDIKKTYDFNKEDQQIEIANDTIIFIPMKNIRGR